VGSREEDVEISTQSLNNIHGSSQIRDILFSAVEGNMLWKTRKVILDSVIFLMRIRAGLCQT
jgi:hypothetical protein